jgi:hypothetical protein
LHPLPVSEQVTFAVALVFCQVDTPVKETAGAVVSGDTGIAAPVPILLRLSTASMLIDVAADVFTPVAVHVPAVLL